MSETINNEINDETLEKVVEAEPITLVGLETEETEIEINGVAYIEKTTYRVYSDGSKVFACSSQYPKPSEEVVEPTQLDRIEEAVNKSQQDIIDAYTLELIEGGVI